MSVKFIGFSGDSAILSENELKTKDIVRLEPIKSKNTRDDYFLSEIVPLLERIENCTAFFGETEHSL